MQNVFVLFVILDKADNELQLLYRVYRFAEAIALTYR